MIRPEFQLCRHAAVPRVLHAMLLVDRATRIDDGAGEAREDGAGIERAPWNRVDDAEPALAVAPRWPGCPGLGAVRDLPASIEA